MLPSEALLRGREIKFPTRRSYGCLALAFTAFAVYGSLLPADFHSIPLNAAWDHFTTSILTVPSSRVSRTDVLANVLLFVPIGFTLAGSLLLDRGRRFAFRAVGVILPSSVAVSLATEFLQTFTESRVPSIIDVTAQTAGCVVGVGAWMALGDSITTWCRATLAATGGDRLFRILSAYTVGWIFINLAPFDITVDLSDLLGRLRSGRIAFTPFAGSDFPVDALRMGRLRGVCQRRTPGCPLDCLETRRRTSVGCGGVLLRRGDRRDRRNVAGVHRIAFRHRD